MIDCAHIAEQPVDRFGDARQRVTGLAGELGVVEQNLDRPLDLFGDALSGAVTAGEKFEVRQIVVRGRFDPVMDGFVGPQDSAKVLLHDEPVFKDFSTFDAVLVRESQPNVALFRDVPGNFSGVRRALLFVAVDEILALKGATARIAARLGSIFAVPGRGEDRRADRAGLRVDGSPADMRAFPRAIERVFAEHLVVGAKFARISLKRFAAVFAGKLNRHDVGPGSAVNIFVGAVTHRAAKPSASLGVSVRAGEAFSALVAGQIGRHVRLLLSTSYQYSVHEALSTAMCEGAV
jgi:hypothetical protein